MMTEKRKRWLFSALTVFLVLFGLFHLLTSSYAVCNWYLPVLSRVLNIRLTAQEVDWHIAHQSVTFRGLQLTLPNDTHFSARKMIATLSYPDLTRGILSLEKIEVLDADLFFSDLTSAAKPSAGLRNLNRIRLGAQDIHNLTVRYSRKNSGSFFRIVLDYLHGSPIVPGGSNAIRLYSGIVWQGNDMEVQLPLNGRLLYWVDQDLNPTRLRAVLETEEPDVNIYRTNFSGLRLKMKLDATRNREDSSIRLDQCDLSAFDNTVKILLAKLNGTYKRDAFSLALTAETADAVTALNNILPIPLKQDKNPVSAVFRGKLAMDQDTFLLDDLFCRMQQNGQTILEAAAEGQTAAGRNPVEKTWNIQNRPSALTLKAENFPVAIFDQYLPFQVHNGALSADYRMKIDPVMLSGTFSAVLKDLELNQNDQELFRRHTLRMQSSFRSSGLVDLKELQIPELVLSAEDKNGKFAQMTLNGLCDFTKDQLRLSGTAESTLRKLLEKIALPPFQFLAPKLGDTQTHSKIEAALDLPAQTLSYSAQASTNAQALPAPLKMESRGEMQLHPGRQKCNVKHFSLSVPNHFLFTATGDAVFPAGAGSADFRLERFSPELIRALWSAAEPDDPYDKELLKKIAFRNMTAACRIKYHGQDDYLEVTKADVDFAYAPGQHLRLNLAEPMTGQLRAMQFNPGKGVLHLADLPMSVCNMFIPDYMRFAFSDGAINGTADLKFLDLYREIHFDANLFIDDLSATKRKVKINCGSTSVTGKGAFLDYFRQFMYYDGVGRVMKDGESILEVNGNGSLDMFAPYKADFYFQCAKITEDYMARFCDLIRYRDFSADGTFSVHCINNYRDMDVKMEQHIRKAIPFYPEDSVIQPPELHGKLDLNYAIDGKAKSLIWRNSSLVMKNSDEKDVFHLALNGNWRQQTAKHMTFCNLYSNAADLQMLYLAGRAAKVLNRQNKEHVLTTVSQPGQPAGKWKITDSEPEAIDMAGFATKLQVQLRNWTYTDLLQAELDALFLTENNTFSAKNISGKVNNGTFVFHADADVGKEDGWELKADGTLENLDIATIIECFGSDSLKEKEISGKVDLLRLTAETKGITPDSLDKNLKVNGCAEVSNISFPLTASGDLAVLRVLLFPMTLLPRMINMLPESTGMFRDMLKASIIGDSLDIISGRKNLNLSRGQARIHSSGQRGTDLIFDKLLLSGPAVRMRTKSLRVNPFHNELDISTETYFGGLYYPIDFSGTLDEPEVSYDNLVKNLMHPGILARNLAPIFYNKSEEWQFEDRESLMLIKEQETEQE